MNNSTKNTDKVLTVFYLTAWKLKIPANLIADLRKLTSI